MAPLLICPALSIEKKNEGKSAVTKTKKVRALKNPKFLKDAKDVALENSLASVTASKISPDTGKEVEKPASQKHAEIRAAIGASPNQPMPTPDKPVVQIRSGVFKGKTLAYASPRKTYWHEQGWAITFSVFALPLIFFGYAWWSVLKIPTAMIIGYQMIFFVELPVMKLGDWEITEESSWIWLGIELVSCITFVCFYIFFKRFAWLWTGFWVCALLGKYIYFLTVWTFGTDQKMQFWCMYWMVIWSCAILGTWMGRFMGEKFLVVGTPFLGAAILTGAIGSLTGAWPQDANSYSLAAFHTDRMFHLCLFIGMFSVAALGIIVQKMCYNRMVEMNPDMTLKIDMNQTGILEDISEKQENWLEKIKNTMKNGMRKIAGKVSVEEEAHQKAYEKKREFSHGGNASLI